MSRDLAGYARSGAWSVVAQAVHLIGSIVLSIVVVRSLSKHDFGVLSELRQITALAVVLASLALERTALRFIPELVENGGGRAAARFFWRTLAVRLAVWVPLFIATILLRPQLEAVFRVPLGNLAVLGVGTALAFLFFNHARACASARFATRQVATGTTVGSVLTLVATLVALSRGFGVGGVLFSAGLGLFVGGLLIVPAVIRSDPPPAAKHAPTSGLQSGRFARMAVPFAGIAILNFLVHSETEVLFLGYFHGPELAGLFKLGFSFAQRMIDFLPLALWEVSMAGFSRIAVVEPERLPAALRSYLILLYLLMAPLVCLGVAFSPAAIQTLYGADMLGSAIVSQSYFIMAGFAALGAPIGMIVYARERTARAFQAYVVFAIVNVGLDVTLIPLWGLWGGIVALACAKLVAVLLMARIAWTEIPQLSIPWSFLIKSFVASAPVLGWLWFGSDWTSLWQLAVGGVVALLVLVLSFRLWRVVGADEAALIRGTRLPLREPALRILGVPPLPEAQG